MMTDRQIELARHALGLSNGRRRKVSYRNYFCASPGHADYADWAQMVAAGVATMRLGGKMFGGDDIFYLTKAGAHEALRAGERLAAEDFPDLKR